MNLEPIQNAQLNFSGLPHEEGLKWASVMPEHSTVSFAGKLTYPGYRDVPATYIITTEDSTVPVEMQKAMIDNMRGVGAEVQVLEIQTDHFPYISATDKVVDAIVEAAGV